jgi:fumarate hydratase subunit alpha
MNGYDEIVAKVAETVVRASTEFSPDQIWAYERAIGCDDNEHARWALTTILDNARVAAEKRLPLCDDTGIPHVFLEVGNGIGLPPFFLAAVRAGVVMGLQRLPGRPMAVLGDDAERISQSVGLDADSGAVSLAPIQIREVGGEEIRLTVMMLGGGPKIRGKTLRVFHKHSLDNVLAEMISWATDGVDKLGCLPGVLFFGIGRTNVEAASLALEALKDADFTKQSEIERKITEAVNAAAIGPLGLGGRNTVLATFVKVGPARASGVRVVSLRTGCCFDPRRASVVFKK